MPSREASKGNGILVVGLSPVGGVVANHSRLLAVNVRVRVWFDYSALEGCPTHGEALILRELSSVDSDNSLERRVKMG